jgi:hypothetical protein
MSAPRHLQLCDGLGMRSCDTCARNVDNNPGIVPESTIKPAADPPRCTDWMAIHTAARDATHGRL